MPGIFRIDKDKNIIPLKEVLSLVPELEKLTSNELKYIVMVYDNRYSPFWQKPIDERKSMAIKRLYGNKEVKLESRKRVQEGIQAYKSITYDERLEAIDSGKKKIAHLNSKLADPEIIKSSELKDLEAAIAVVQRMIDTNLEKVIRDESNIMLKGKTKKLSLLEKMKRSMELYKLKEDKK